MRYVLRFTALLINQQSWGIYRPTAMRRQKLKDSKIPRRHYSRRGDWRLTFRAVKRFTQVSSQRSAPSIVTGVTLTRSPA